MKKALLILMVGIAILFASCGKTSTTPQTPGSTKVDSPYYFKFTLDGKDYNLNYYFPQYVFFSNYYAGGYQVGSIDLEPTVGLEFGWQLKDSIYEADLMALVGKTIYFDDKITAPEMSFSEENFGDSWSSVDTADKNFYVKINSIKFRKLDTALAPVRTYVINGTCRAAMRFNYGRVAVLDNGEFNFIISHRDNQ